DGLPPEPDARSKIHGFRFPTQQHKLDPGDTVYDPVTMKRAGEIVAIDGVGGPVRRRRGPTLEDVALPTSLIPGGPYTTKDQQAALMRVGQSLLAGDGRYPHLAALLRREPPLGGARAQCEGLGEMGRLLSRVEGVCRFVP